MINDNFVALNILDIKTKESLFDYPIVYYWNGQDKLENMFYDSMFYNRIIEKLTYRTYFETKIFLTYIYKNDEEESEYIKKEFDIKDIYEFPERFIKDILFEIIDYLYLCSFKENLKRETFNIKDAFDKIQSKHPNKVNSNVVSKYIQSKLYEDYTFLDKVMINKILETFFNEI